MVAQSAGPRRGVNDQSFPFSWISCCRPSAVQSTSHNYHATTLAQEVAVALIFYIGKPRPGALTGWAQTSDPGVPMAGETCPAAHP